MLDKIIRDCSGASLVEFTLVFPIVIAVTFGTVDFLYMLHEWNMASKATYRGARFAIRSNPAMVGVTNPAFTPGHPGDPCFVLATGAPDGTVNCPTFNLACSSATPCDDPAAFADIVAEMQATFLRIEPQHVLVRYQSTGLGFSDSPYGLPAAVTVSLQCMAHQTFFFGAWMGWLFPPASACVPARSIAMPVFASTLPSEDLSGTRAAP